MQYNLIYNLIHFDFWVYSRKFRTKASEWNKVILYRVIDIKYCWNMECFAFILHFALTKGLCMKHYLDLTFHISAVHQLLIHFKLYFNTAFAACNVCTTWIPSREIYMYTVCFFIILNFESLFPFWCIYRKDNKTDESLDTVLEHHQNMQEKIAEEMIQMAQNIKHNSLVACNILKKDTKVSWKLTSNSLFCILAVFIFWFVFQHCLCSTQCLCKML